MRSIRDSAGLTLLEVVIGMLILSVALAGLAIAFPVSRIAVHEGGQYTVAANIAQDAIERLKRLPFDGPVGVVDLVGLGTGDISGNPVFAAPPSPYTRAVLVEDLETLDGIVTMKRVTVNVTFSLQGANTTATLATLFVR